MLEAELKDVLEDLGVGVDVEVGRRDEQLVLALPKKGLLEIKKVLEQGPSSKIAIKTPHLFLVQDDLAIAVKLIDAQFPPYEQVIPKEHKKVITIDRVRFIDALRRAQLIPRREVRCDARGRDHHERQPRPR